METISLNPTDLPQIKELKLEDPERERCKPEGGSGGASRDNPDPGSVSPSSKEAILRVYMIHPHNFCYNEFA